MTEVSAARPFRLAEQKLTTPASRGDPLVRTRLLDELDGASPVRRVAIVAAAGYGKTTVLEQWIARRWPRHAVAWFSVDERDDDPVRFWSYLAEAFRRLGAAFDGHLVAELRQDPEAADELVVELSNSLLSRDEPCLVVLDDLHRVTSAEVLEPLGRLVESVPPSTTVAITTRTTVPWPTERWHAHGELLVLDASDLAFRPDETEAVLGPVLDDATGEPRLDGVQQKTEGWPVAVQLLAHALRRAPDPAAVLASFDGADRVIAGFLLEEVLGGLSARVHRFLLDISVVDSFCVDLASAIVGEDCTDLVTEVRAERLFVVALDDRGEWSRLHHLIRDLLLAELTATDPVRRRLLSRRAAGWFDEQGSTSQAIEQMVAAGDHDAALELMADSVEAYHAAGRTPTLLRLVDEIPIEEIERRPAAAAHIVLSLTAVGRLPDARGWLEVAARGAQSDADHLDVAFARHFVERAAGQESAALEATAEIERLARSAQDVSVRDRAARLSGAAQIAIALAAEFLGDDARRRSAVAELDRRRDEMGLIAASMVDPLVARLAADDGDLVTATSRARRSVERDDRLGHAHPGLAHVHLALAKAAWAGAELDQAQEHLRAAAVLDLGHAVWIRTLRSIAAAEVLASLHRHDGVDEILEHAWVGERSSPTPTNSRAMVAAWGGWLGQLHGRPDVATAWWNELDRLDAGVPLDDAIWARRAIHEHRAAAVNERFGRNGERLPTQPLRRARAGLALVSALTSTGEHEAARALASRIVAAAELDGLVQPVLDDGHAIELVAAERAGPASRFADPIPGDAGRASPAGAGEANAGLIDPLSPRELEVLPLLPSRMTNQEIAGHLYVSLNTVKTHLRHIYRKLGVMNRDEAIERCGALGLL